jgi:hypothetical protein
MLEELGAENLHGEVCEGGGPQCFGPGGISYSEFRHACFSATGSDSHSIGFGL